MFYTGWCLWYAKCRVLSGCIEESLKPFEKLQSNSTAQIFWKRYYRVDGKYENNQKLKLKFYGNEIIK